MERHHVRGNDAEQHERDRNHMKREEAVQRDIRNGVVAANPDAEVLADDRYGREQVDDHLRSPIGHLTPREQIAEKRFGHQAKIDETAEDPCELARFAVAAVQQPAVHVQIDHDEEHRSTSRVHVTDEPAPRNIAHDVFDRLECLGRIRLVAHREENARDDLDHERKRSEGAEVVPEIEILRRDVLAPLTFPKRGQRKAVVDPGQKLLHCARPVA